MRSFQYCCDKVMEFLDFVNASYSTRLLYLRVFRSFGEFLETKDTAVSLEAIEEWIPVSGLSECDTSRCRFFLLRLCDVWKYGYITPANIQNGKYYYLKLNDHFKQYLDDYLDNRKNDVQKGYITDLRTSLSHFLLYCQENSCHELGDIRYDHLFCYDEKCSHYYQDSSRKLCEGHISSFLRFCYDKGSVTHGLSYIYANQCSLPWIIRWEEISKDNQSILLQERKKEDDFDGKDVYALIHAFIDDLLKESYSDTVLKYSRTTIEFLSVFLDMNDLPYTLTVSDVFYDELSRRNITSIRALRRTLWLFKEFVRYGSANHSVRFRYSPSKLECFPDWCRKPIENFLQLKKKEKKMQSTIDMYRSAIMRLCNYLIKQGLNDFKDLNADHLVGFNKEDLHNTAEGKNAYNVRIRKFLDYLFEEGLIDNSSLSSALLSKSAKRRRIIEILNEEEIEIIKQAADVKDPLALRDKALLALGFYEGLRASDIVGLRFSDIDWKNKTINIIQKKTSKALTLPLVNEAGNAVYRYIKYGRPSFTESDFIFVNFKAPHGKISRGVCLNAMNRVLPHRINSGTGFHILRKTYASRLLSAGSAISGVSEALGHSGNSTVHEYLNLDEEMIRKCSLSLKETGLELREDIFKC